MDTYACALPPVYNFRLPFSASYTFSLTLANVLMEIHVDVLFTDTKKVSLTRTIVLIFHQMLASLDNLVGISKPVTWVTMVKT